MKNKPSLYVDNKWFHFDFWCNKNIHQIKMYSEKDIIVQCGLLRNGVVEVLIWYGEDRHLIVHQTVPYIESQHYSIKCLYGYVTREIRFESFMMPHGVLPICTYVGPKSNKEVEFYKCEKYLHPREAKKLWKYINKRKLVSKAIWDPELEMYDWKCKACDYSWVSNPDIGYVRKFEDDPEVMRHFSYKGIDYSRCEDWENSMLTFYNKEEWEAAVKQLGYPEGTYKSFDEMWEKPFVRGTWEEVNRSNEEQGHWWRCKSKHNWLVDDEYYASSDNPKYFEKVITPGWHQSHPANAKRCPVCEDLYQIMQSGWRPLTPIQRFKEWYRWWSEYRMFKKNK